MKLTDYETAIQLVNRKIRPGDEIRLDFDAEKIEKRAYTMSEFELIIHFAIFLQRDENEFPYAEDEIHYLNFHSVLMERLGYDKAEKLQEYLEMESKPHLDQLNNRIQLHREEKIAKKMKKREKKLAKAA